MAVSQTDVAIEAEVPVLPPISIRKPSRLAHLLGTRVDSLKPEHQMDVCTGSGLGDPSAFQVVNANIARYFSSEIGVHGLRGETDAILSLLRCKLEMVRW